MSDKFPSTGQVRIYARHTAPDIAPETAEEPVAPASATATSPSPPDVEQGVIDDELDEVVRTMIAARKLQRDMAQLARDPSQLPGFEQLPAAVQALASIDPMAFLTLRKLGEAGMDLNAIAEFQERMQQELDKALKAAGWDESRLPTDEELDRAGAAVRRLLDG